MKSWLLREKRNQEITLYFLIIQKWSCDAENRCQVQYKQKRTFTQYAISLWDDRPTTGDICQFMWIQRTLSLSKKNPSEAIKQNGLFPDFWALAQNFLWWNKVGHSSASMPYFWTKHLFSPTVWNTDHAVACLLIWCPIGLGLTYSLRNYLCIYQFKFCNSPKLIFLVEEIPFQHGALMSCSYKCLPRPSQNVEPIGSAQIRQSALKAEEQKLPEAGQPLVKQKLCYRTGECQPYPCFLPGAFHHLTQAKSFGLHATCLAAIWAGMYNFCYLPSPQTQYYLFSRTTTNSSKILAGKGKNLKEHGVKGKGEENGEKLFTKMKLRTGSASLTQYSRKKQVMRSVINRQGGHFKHTQEREVSAAAEEKCSLVCQECYCYFP